MPFKSFVTTLMELLEDADGMVRDTARNTVITLFQYGLYKFEVYFHVLTDTETHPMPRSQI